MCNIHVPYEKQLYIKKLIIVLLPTLNSISPSPHPRPQLKHAHTHIHMVLNVHRNHKVY